MTEPTEDDFQDLKMIRALQEPDQVIFEDQSIFVSLKVLMLDNAASPMVFAAAIERHGIYTWDRFLRFRRADEGARERALDALSDCFQWTLEQAQKDGFWETDDDDDDVTIPPLPPYPGLDYLGDFGWPSGELPDFEAILKEPEYSRASHPNRSAETRRTDTLLVLVAALAAKAGIDIGKHGAIKAVKDATELIGAPVHEDTISALLRLIREAVDKRSR